MEKLPLRTEKLPLGIHLHVFQIGWLMYAVNFPIALEMDFTNLFSLQSWSVHSPPQVEEEEEETVDGDSDLMERLKAAMEAQESPEQSLTPTTPPTPPPEPPKVHTLLIVSGPSDPYTV